MTVQRMDNVGIVVDDLVAVTAFLVDLGLELVGGGMVQGDWVDRVTGLAGVRTEIAMLQTPDGHGRIELMKFHDPPVGDGDAHAPPNTLGIRRIAFTVDDIDAAVDGLRARGTELLGEVGHGAWRELAATDAANRQLWGDLGFTVHELTSFHSFAQHFGALHCITKELARDAGGGPAGRGRASVVVRD